MADKKKATKKKADAPAATVITDEADLALLEWHDELKKLGHVEAAANILKAYQIVKTDKAQAVINAIVKGALTPKEIVTLALAVFSVIK